ncbi:peroxiredoxin family protein [Mucilaginibacter celer]|uniref:TlpA family protein disulfide reductase n=1 Tax=Mucilaginibacter celer TaxID=2305508 RepID=A0A494W0E6_9SPHI|nr:TlpA disulfide reductase family protein [Mucilaginibacter celer]AYL99250.1 TlpA family protein disulfide reductase [Mucilaginibacter celer]
MKYTYLLFLFALLSFKLLAQEAAKPTVKTQTFSIDEHSVVKDSTGKILTFKEWGLLMRTKQYDLWPENFEDSNPAFILRKKGYREVRYASPGEGATKAEPQKQLSAEEIKEQYLASLPKPMESAYFTTGEAIEPFSTRDLNNNKIKLKELRGKIVVLNFWFIGCPACMQEIPELNKLVDDYKNNPNVVFLGIALDYSWDLRKFLKTTAFNYDIIDNGRYIADGYKIGLYPTNVILDKEGKVAFHSVGFAPNSPYWMRKTIDESLK